MADSLIGTTIGKYKIIEAIGRGGMARVYKAHQQALDRYVAIKLMYSHLAGDEVSPDRFQLEAKAVASLRHPNIVQMHDFDIVDGAYYMVMEFVEGYTLKARLQELSASDEFMPLGEAIRVTRDVAAALSYAHARGMVHRDVKPANVMVNQDNQVILMDFGVAKMMSGPQHTITGVTVGTPLYMAPEQGLGKGGDPRSDIYSLGVVLFQMGTGQLPFVSDTHAQMAIVLKHIYGPIPHPSKLNPSLPEGMERIIFKMMAKDPEDRYQSADEVIEHLDWVKAGVFIPEEVAPPADLGRAVEQTGEATSVSSTLSFLVPVSAAELGEAVRMAPYTLSSKLVAHEPADLPRVCEKDWDRAVTHFTKGYICRWLQDCEDSLRNAHQHDLADSLTGLTERGNAIMDRIQNGDAIARNAGLEELLELIGAPAPIIDPDLKSLMLAPVGVSEAGKPVSFAIKNQDRGYISGTVTATVPWLKVTPAVFGCRAGKECTLTVTPDVSRLPVGEMRSRNAIHVQSNGGDLLLDVEVDILPAVLETDVSTVDFGRVGLGETARAAVKLRNGGRGVLTGTVRARMAWLKAMPDQFSIPGGESVEVMVEADTWNLDSDHEPVGLALVVESNGGYAVLRARIEFLPPRLQVEPESVDLGVLDVTDARTAEGADLVVSNAGAGVLTGQVTAGVEWLRIEPVGIACGAGDSQVVHLAPVIVQTGDHKIPVCVTTNAGTVEVPILLRARFSMEPEMMHIPAGPFLRGSKERDKSAADAEKPQREIHLTEYWIGRFPVTNAQYAAFLQSARRRPPPDWRGLRPPDGKENHPVVKVTWYNATAYCRWLAKVTGKSYRLQSEAEWEKAARGTDGRQYPWGNKWDSMKANTREGGIGDTTPVGIFSPDGDSSFGCGDVAGNVWEWTADWYDAGYYGRSSRAEDPFGPASGATRVLRGGEWNGDARSARCACRSSGSPTLLDRSVGFRCVIV